MRWPPAVPVALAFAAGIATSAAIGSTSLPVFLVLLAAVPIRPWRRAPRAFPLLLVAVAGLLSGQSARHSESSDCRWGLEQGVSYRVQGRFAGSVGPGGTFLIERMSPGPPCRRRVRARLRTSSAPGATALPGAPGRPIAADARWVPWRGAERPERAGTLVLSNVEPAGTPTGRAQDSTRGPEAGSFPGAAGGRARESLTGALLFLRGALLVRVERIFGRAAPTVEALILARKERLDPSVREAYARSGVAHLLAISGFHVGVVAAMLAVLGGRFFGRRSWVGTLAPAGGVWAYVLIIGAPPAAVRAAAIGSVLAASRLRGRPTSRRAGLAIVLLGFLAIQPRALSEVGFQLSFAGAAGLVFLAPRLEHLLREIWPRGLRARGLSALAVSLAATLATAPVVAWHFGELPLLGIPMTALLTPLIAASIVGALASLALDAMHPVFGALAAGGTTLLLDLSGVIAEAVSGRGWVVVGAGRAALAGGVVGAALGWWRRPTARDGWGDRTWRERPRMAVARMAAAQMTAFVVAGVVAGPVVQRVLESSTAELVAVDVGQGDAILIRSPRGRWLLVDAGPAGRDWDAGASRVVPYLESRSVDRLEALLLSHPDLDHFGGARAVLDRVEVANILDPGVPASKQEWKRLLEFASASQVPWTVVDSTRSLALDGLHIELWKPPDTLLAKADGSVANAASLIIVVRFGAFTALLTGDAPVLTEDAFAGRVGDVDVLKVGHHGSRTSTSDSLLAAVLPEVAIISVGRRNRYGHPHPTVLDRLRSFGARIVRTDLEGTVRVRFKADGRYWVEGI